MNVLFLHQNFPGQFRHLAQRLAARPGNRVVSIGQASSVAVPGVTHLRYKPRRQPAKSTHRYLLGTEAAVLAGQAVVQLLFDLRRQGFVPDVVVAHPGWGEALYVKDAFPRAKVFHFSEFYYRTDGADAGFDPAFPLSADDRARLRTRNALHLLNLEQCDVAVTPTHWQKSVHPQAYLPRLHVIHEGIDAQVARPAADAVVRLPNGRDLTRRDPVVTYVARNLEPYRGFPNFMRLVERLLVARPDVQVLIVGADGVSYGSAPQDGGTWKERVLRDVQIDGERVHFLGRLSHEHYLRVLQLSSAHVYLTYPFVLSWSMLEAMACGCVVIGSRTAPVEEVIRDGHNGWLVDFFDTDAQLARLTAVLDDASGRAEVGAAARRTVLDRYSIDVGCGQWEGLIERALSGFGWHEPSTR